MQRDTRRQLKHDEFVDTTMGAVQRVVENPRPWIFGAVAIVVVVFGTWGLTSWWMSRRAEAEDRLARGLAALTAPVADDGVEGVSADPYNPTFATHEQKVSAAIADLEASASRGGEAGRLAGYLHGVALLEQGRGEEALPALSQAARNLGDDPTLGHLVRAAHAKALDATGQPERSVAIWESLAGESGEEASYPRALALESLALAREAAGNVDGAKAAWKSIVDEFPDSPQAITAARELERVEG